MRAAGKKQVYIYIYRKCIKLLREGNARKLQDVSILDVNARNGDPEITRNELQLKLCPWCEVDPV